MLLVELFHHSAQLLDIVVIAGISRSLNADNSYRVIIHIIEHMLQVQHQIILCNRDGTQFYIPVNAELLPANLVGGADYQIGARF